MTPAEIREEIKAAPVKLYPWTRSLLWIAGSGSAAFALSLVTGKI